MEDVGQGGDESGGGALAVMEQLSTFDMAVSMSRACLRVGAMKGALASARVLTADSTVSLLPPDVFKHHDLCRASHFFLASSSCSLLH